MSSEIDHAYRRATDALLEVQNVSAPFMEFFLLLHELGDAQRLGLHCFDADIGVIETVAVVDTTGSFALSGWTPVAPELRTTPITAPLTPLHWVENLREHMLLGATAAKAGFSGGPSSLLIVQLDKGHLGFMAVQYREGAKPSAALEALLGSLTRPLGFLLNMVMRQKQLESLQEILTEDKRFFEEELRQSAGDEVVGADGGLRAAMTLVHQVAHQQCPVLLTGETGAGKEVIARALHQLSPRRDGPFIRVNCGAIPEHLIDSELFGHERGAFTGSIAQHRGRFERAHNGTIFLDEIGELPPQSQTRLLRVLQDNEVERVGGSRPVPVDFRVIAATNAELKQAMETGKFRRDLYYRLCVFPIHLPPLRARGEDLPALVGHFVAKKCQAMRLSPKVVLQAGALEQLLDYPWPGNVRELENAIERALILSPRGPLTFPFLHSAETSAPPAAASADQRGANATTHVDLKTELEQHETALIVQALTNNQWNRRRAAEALQVPLRTLSHRMSLLRIRRP